MQQAEQTSSFICGVVEGFYGKPWTPAQRKELFVRMQEFGMNTYVYAPKDDLKHRVHWRDLYTVEEADNLQSLINAAKEHDVEFVYALSPGLDVTYSSSKEISIAKQKLQQIFSSFAHAQVSLTNEIYEHLGQPKFMFCPTEYCESRAVPDLYTSEYLNVIGQKLLNKIDVLWTGPRVISRLLSPEHLKRVGDVIKRRPLIWDNLHANDYDPRRVFLGPYHGRPSAIKSLISGVVTNPNCEFEANFVALHTLAHWSTCSSDADLKGEEVKKLEIENEDNASDAGDASFRNLPAFVYHPRRALDFAVERWLREFSEPKNAVGSFLSRKPPSLQLQVSSSGSIITSTQTSGFVEPTAQDPAAVNGPSTVPLLSPVISKELARSLSHSVNNGTVATMVQVPHEPPVEVPCPDPSLTPAMQAVNSLTSDYEAEPMELAPVVPQPVLAGTATSSEIAALASEPKQQQPKTTFLVDGEVFTSGSDSSSNHKRHITDVLQSQQQTDETITKRPSTFEKAIPSDKDNKIPMEDSLTAGSKPPAAESIEVEMTPSQQSGFLAPQHGGFTPRGQDETETPSGSDRFFDTRSENLSLKVNLSTRSIDSGDLLDDCDDYQDMQVESCTGSIAALRSPASEVVIAKCATSPCSYTLAIDSPQTNRTANMSKGSASTLFSDEAHMQVDKDDLDSTTEQQRIDEIDETASAADSDGFDGTMFDLASHEPGPLTKSDLSLLVQLFYLPFEHGSRALSAIEEFQWLRMNARAVTKGKLNGKQELAEEWTRRAQNFYQLVYRVDKIFMRVVSSVNRSLVYDLFPYVWDILGILHLLKTFVMWLGCGYFNPKPFDDSLEYAFERSVSRDRSFTDCTGAPSSENEPWVYSKVGGLQADLQRQLPLETGQDLFMCRPPFPPTPQFFVVRVYEERDHNAIYRIWRQTMDDGMDASDRFSGCLDLPGDRFVGAFLKLSPEHCFVLEDSHSKTVVGFALAAKDSKALHRATLASYLPFLKTKYPLPSSGLSGSEETGSSESEDAPMLAPGEAGQSAAGEETAAKAGELLADSRKAGTSASSSTVNAEGNNEDSNIAVPGSESSRESSVSFFFQEARRVTNKELIRSIHSLDNSAIPDSLYTRYPSVVYLRLLPIAVDSAAPKRLAVSVLSSLKANGSYGVYAELDASNKNLHDFHTRLGFFEVTMVENAKKDCVYLGRIL